MHLYNYILLNFAQKIMRYKLDLKKPTTEVDA